MNDNASVGGVITLADLRPGDFMIGPIGGFVPGVLPVGVGQVALATRKARLSWRSWWRYRHVGVVTQASPTPMPHLLQPPFQPMPPSLVQAMPHGAEEVEMSAGLHWTARHIYLRPDYQQWAQPSSMLNLPYKQAELGFDVATQALKYVHTPYNFLTYGKLAASALHLPVTERVLRRWISTRHDMMCSQLADQALADAGFHLFDDGRLPQDVVPAEFFRQLLTMPGQWLIPGLDRWQLNASYLVRAGARGNVTRGAA